MRGKVSDTAKNKDSLHKKRCANDRIRHAPKSRNGCRLNKWNENHMLEAIAEFQKGDRGLREIARLWQVPKTTLARRVKEDGLSAGWRHASGKQPVLPDKNLAEHAIILSRRGFPLTRKDIQKVAYDYATKNNLCGFNPARGSAGHYWFKGFQSRHPEISVRKPESLSVGQVRYS